MTVFRFDLTEVADLRGPACLRLLPAPRSRRQLPTGDRLQRRLHGAAAIAVGVLEMTRPAATKPASPCGEHPIASRSEVESALRADLHAFLSGTSDRLLVELMPVCTTRRSAHLQPGLVRDRELAAGFFTYGPQALRRLRLRHRRRTGPLPRHVIERMLAQEMRSMTADIRLVARTDPRHDPLGRRTQRWSTPAADAHQAPDTARKGNPLPMSRPPEVLSTHRIGCGAPAQGRFVRLLT